MTAAARDAAHLLELVLTAAQDDDLPGARRHLVVARTGAGEDAQLRGTIAALELVCDARAGNEDDEQPQRRARELAAGTTGESVEFSNAVGCALSDAGERLGDAAWIEAADSWFVELRARVAADPVVLVNHAVVLERQDRLDDAIAALAKAVELDPALDRAWLRLARAATRTGELARAADAYRRFLESHPDDAHERISLAIVLCDLGQIEEAEQAYWRAAALEPANASLHFNWAISALRAKDVERARTAHTRLRAAAPADWRTRLAEAFILDHTGDPQAAFQLARQVFLDLIATRDDEHDHAGPIAYVAGRAAEIARQAFLASGASGEAPAFIGELIAEELFTDETLALIRAIEQPVRRGALTHAVQLEALYRDQDEPFACFVNYRVLARDAGEAGELARAFEQRCGANEVRVQEGGIERLDDKAVEAHVGVRWRSERMAFPADEFGTE